MLLKNECGRCCGYKKFVQAWVQELYREGVFRFLYSLCILRNMLIMQTIVLHSALQGGRRAAGSDGRHGLQQKDTIS